jgi:hypothetical protein
MTAAVSVRRCVISTSTDRNLEPPVWLKLSLGSWSPVAILTTPGGVPSVRWSSSQLPTLRGRSVRAARFPSSQRTC